MTELARDFTYAKSIYSFMTYLVAKEINRIIHHHHFSFFRIHTIVQAFKGVLRQETVQGHCYHIEAEYM